MERLLGVVDAARLLGISPWTVRKIIREGKLRPVRLGVRVLLEQSDIENFVSKAKQIPSANFCASPGASSEDLQPRLGIFLQSVMDAPTTTDSTKGISR